jgi:hypothetical protein
VLPNGKKVTGLKIDHPRQLALMHALVRFAHIAAGGKSSTREIHTFTAEAPGMSVGNLQPGILAL